MKEEWHIVSGFPDYQVSSAGRVRSFKRSPLGRLMKPSVGKETGRAIVTMHIDGRPYYRLLARLVCEAFYGPAPTKEHQAAHEDGNPSNDTKQNLSWKTRVENAADKIRHGRLPRGSSHANSLLTERQITKIRDTHASRKAAGRSYGTNKMLAEKYDVSIWTIEDIVSRNSWRHI